MDAAMPPPSKRRKLSSATEEVYELQVDRSADPLATHPHRIERLPTAESSSSPRHVEEVHLEIRKLSWNREHEKLHRRQGTAALTDSANSVATVTISAAVDDFGATVALTTVAPGTEAGVFPTTSTVTFVDRPGTTADSADLPGSSNPPSSSPTSASPNRGSDAPVLVADVSSSDPSPASASPVVSPSTSPSVSPSASPSSEDVPSSTISVSAASASAATTSASDAISSDTPVVPADVADESSNSTSISPSTGFSGSSSSELPTIPATATGSDASSLSSLNQTTASATSLTSSTSVDLSTVSDSASLAAASASASASVSDFTLGFGLFRATRADGRIVTLSRSDEPYTTSFDGQLTTISPTTRLTGSPTTSPGGRSGRLTTSVDGDQTSIFLVTQTMSPSNSGAADRSTITSNVNGAAATGAIVGAGDAGTPVSSPTPSASLTSNNNNDSNDDTPPTPVLAGGVVGGVAGLAVVVLIAMLLIRWYRRRGSLGSHQALPSGSAAMSPGPEEAEFQNNSVADGSSRGPGMAERAGLMPLAAAVPGFFRHLNRSSEAASSEPSERGFTRVSGRKLPSAFSEGMSSSGGPFSDPVSPGAAAAPLAGYSDHDRNLSSTSFYRDSAGFYGGDGDEGAPHTPVVGGAPGRENIMLSPGPRRTPTVRKGGPYVMSPTTLSPTSQMSPPGTAAGRDTPERGSRFTEEV